MSSEGLLKVNNINKSFRGVQAVKSVSFSLKAGEIMGVIGPNGAGKTTLFNLIAGALTPDSGEIFLQNYNITGLRPDQACQLGIARTFQLVKPFRGISVVDNVTIGALRQEASLSVAKKRACNILEHIELSHKVNSLAAHLTLPEMKRLEVGRALATGPKLLLLDEVMAGLRPQEVSRLIDIFKALNASTGLTILMIEHVMQAIMDLSHHIIVLNYGAKISEGTPDSVVRDPRVLDCYLGMDPLDAEDS